jgi:CRP-like cAMP-binding protein
MKNRDSSREQAGDLSAMVKSYLVIQQGLIEERVFHLGERNTVGRSPVNTIYLSDPSVSRRHAVIYFAREEAVVEDLESHNGTFVNGERVQRATLTSGDSLVFGKVTLRFLQEEVREDSTAMSTQEMLGATQEVLQANISVSPDTGVVSQRSRRLSEAISRTPLFSSLDSEGLAHVAQAARLLVFDRGRTVCRQGDRGKSIFVILDGKVRVVTYDHEGKELHLSILGENQFFGEMSLLTDAPRNATVQVIEESLLCEIGYDVLREIIRRLPGVRGILEEYCRERLNEMEAKKRAAGIVDRRKFPRLNEQLSVSFSVSSTSTVSAQFRGRVFRSLSKDISLSGIRVKVQDRLLMGLPAGCQLRLELAVPQGGGSIRCLGTLRNIVEGKEGQDVGYLGIEFNDMSSALRKRLEEFIR